jgi:molecular chaperone GrpE
LKERDPETPTPRAESSAPEPAPRGSAGAPGDGRREPPPCVSEAALASPEQAEDLPPPDEGDSLRAACEALRAERDAARSERDALQDRLLRLAAEFDNHRKRNAREWQEQRRRAAAEVLRQVLEIADNLERALRSAEADAGGLRRGVELIHQQLQALFKRCGIEVLEARGQPFDPTQHEAVQVVDTDEVQSQHVVDVVQAGYRLHGEILRPARVTVSR